jgi:hypothetical protein
MIDNGFVFTLAHLVVIMNDGLPRAAQRLGNRRGKGNGRNGQGVSSNMYPS